MCTSFINYCTPGTKSKPFPWLISIGVNVEFSNIAFEIFSCTHLAIFVGPWISWLCKVIIGSFWFLMTAIIQRRLSFEFFGYKHANSKGQLFTRWSGADGCCLHGLFSLTAYLYSTTGCWSIVNHFLFYHPQSFPINSLSLFNFPSDNWISF